MMICPRVNLPNAEKQVQIAAKQAASQVDNLDKNKDKVKDGVGKAAGAVGMDKTGRSKQARQHHD